RGAAGPLPAPERRLGARHARARRARGLLLRRGGLHRHPRGRLRRSLPVGVAVPLRVVAAAVRSRLFRGPAPRRLGLAAMDERTRRRVCELVAGLIATDDHLDPSELQYMLKIFRAFGVASGGKDEVVSPATTAIEAAKAMGELPADVREEALGLLIESAVADGQVVAAERAYLQAVAQAAGVDDEILETLIAEALAARAARA